MSSISIDEIQTLIRETGDGGITGQANFHQHMIPRRR